MRLRPAISLSSVKDRSGFGAGARPKARPRRKKRKARRKARPRAQPERVASPERPPEPDVERSERRSRAEAQWRARRLEWLKDVVEPVEEALRDAEVDEDPSAEGARRARPRPETWGPPVTLGRRLRVQAAMGHRAAVIELRPGLHLVAELPEGAARAEFGLVPLLVPLMVTAARRALETPPGQGPLAVLRREPVRYVQLQQAPPAQAPLMLPGPVAEAPKVVAAPNVGWADDATVAEAVGCDQCERCGQGRR